MAWNERDDAQAGTPLLGEGIVIIRPCMVGEGTQERNELYLY